MLTQESIKKVEEVRKRYPTSQAALLPVLWIAQEQEGWISEEMMKYIGGLLALPFAHILGVVTFYTMFNTKKIGKYHIQVCTNVSCQLLGSETIMGYISKKTGCKKGETSVDGRVTLSEVECLGSCGTAPMMQVNDDFHENLTFDKIDALLASMK
jgi:NADH-quinone oxidoreductase E subunit